jgi:Pectate lyase superfamily protein
MRHLYKTTSVSSIWPRQRGKQLIVFLVATILVIAAQAQTPPGTGVAGARVVPPAHANCVMWQGQSDSEANRSSLQLAINNNACVEIPSGTFVVSRSIVVGSNRTVRGQGSSSVIKADPALWTFNNISYANGNEGVFNTIDNTMAGPPPSINVRISNLSIDASGVATYAIAPSGLLDNLNIKNSRCSGVGIVAYGAVVTNSSITSTAKETLVSNNGKSYLLNCRGIYILKSQFTGTTCTTPKQSGNPNYCQISFWANAVDEGAGIYVASPATSGGYPVPARLAPIIRNNTISDTFGPALDVNSVWDGVFQYNLVFGNSSWAGISLYGASNWLVTNNQISHPGNQPGQPYHPNCRDVEPPLNGHSAAIFLCQDADTNNLITQNNFISANKVSSYYGILSVGNRNRAPYMVPRNNIITMNDPNGSLIGCLDKVPMANWSSEKNVWINNFCGGPNTVAPPVTY